MDKIKLRNDDGSINYLAFSEIAEKKAELIDRVALRNKKGDKQNNKSSQLRKFYDELFKINQRGMNYNNNEWQKIILPQLHMLIPKAVYAQGRKLVTHHFVDMIKNLITQVKTKDDLQLAVDFFEAFIGFYRIYREK
ncbi:CRISPR-associated protein Csm2 [Desulfonauticus submarinus]|uniref:CRISPR system Cms protein Csm2 n=1 Tax=Desulfonauticus submarinus TaxID=206665 RepID=A0A1H0FV89_9BACT|nr:type III-A CRISPR-associated protein Csm2 [Desulfonauticus submarinus]SDN98399.1 CRISPR-associated protein Csm2 [Desulfonauticus submarinus]